MNGKPLPSVTMGAGVVFVVCCAVFAFLALIGASATGLIVPVTIGWIMAFVGARPLVERQRLSAFYFAFAVLALMIFFIHETYGYAGKVRNFPLIVGYTGVVLCVLDILSLTGTATGTAISTFFASHIDTAQMSGRPLKRELVAFAAMIGCVLGIWLFGFLVFSPIFVTLWMLAGRKTLKASIYGGVFTIVFIYLLFELAFKYELYRGIVFIWLLDL